MHSVGHGSPTSVIDAQHAGRLLDELLAALGDPRRVLLLPPDYTRRHSWAGELTVMLYERLRDRASVAIMPALGTHAPMTEARVAAMFPGVPPEVFVVHRWRDDLVRLGEVPAELIQKLSGGRLSYAIPCEINRRLVEAPWDRIISIGQVVPHEVAGMANHAKNVFVGAGGAETINKTHYLGAVCGMEQAMGRVGTPVRAVFQHMSAHFAGEWPLTYVLTVRGRAANGDLVTRGLYAGSDEDCFEQAAALSQQVNINLLDEPLSTVVVQLDPHEYHSTWLGNKAIYRTRMALADGGELIVLAPGVRTFGEDGEIDRLIRQYGYRGTPAVVDAVGQDDDLAANLSAAAHLIHGSPEGRFRVTYAAGGLTRDAVEGVGFGYADLDEWVSRFDAERLHDGFNMLPDGRRCFYVSNPGLGLWALRARFENASQRRQPTGRTE